MKAIRNLCLLFCIVLFTNTAYSNEYEAFAERILNNPDSLFVYLSDSSKISKFIYENLHYESYNINKNYFNYIKDNNIKLIEKFFDDYESRKFITYNYDDFQNNSIIQISFEYGHQPRKSKIFKLCNIHLITYPVRYYAERIIERPDSLYEFLKDTNFVYNSVQITSSLYVLDGDNKALVMNPNWYNCREKDKESIREYLIYLKKNNPEKQKMKRYHAGEEMTGYKISLRDPEKDMNVLVEFVFHKDKSNKWRICSLEFSSIVEK